MKRLIIIILLLTAYPVIAQDFELCIPEGHRSFITKIRFTKDGDFLITAAADETVKIWNARLGALLNTYKGSTFDLNEDESVMAVTGENGTYVCEMYSGQVIHTLTSGVNVKFISNSKYLVISGEIWVSIYDTHNYKAINLLRTQNEYGDYFEFDKRQESFEITPDGKHFIAFCDNIDIDGLWKYDKEDRLYVWDITTGLQIGRIALNSRHNIFLRFSKDCKYFYTHFIGPDSLFSDSLVLWDINSQSKIKSVAVPKRTDKKYNHNMGLAGDTLTYISGNSIFVYSLLSFNMLYNLKADTTIKSLYTSNYAGDFAFITAGNDLLLKTSLSEKLSAIPGKTVYADAKFFAFNNNTAAISTFRNIHVVSLITGDNIYSINEAIEIGKATNLTDPNRLLLSFNNSTAILNNSSGEIDFETSYDKYFGYQYCQENNTFLLKNSDSSFAIYSATDKKLKYYLKHDLKLIRNIHYSKDGRLFFIRGYDEGEQQESGGFLIKGSEKIVLFKLKDAHTISSKFSLDDIDIRDGKYYRITVEPWQQPVLISQNTLILMVNVEPRKYRDSLHKARKIIAVLDISKNKITIRQLLPFFYRDVYFFNNKNYFCFMQDSVNHHYIKIYESGTGLLKKAKLLAKKSGNEFKILNDRFCIFSDSTIVDALTDEILFKFPPVVRDLTKTSLEIIKDLVIIPQSKNSGNAAIFILDLKSGTLINSFQGDSYMVNNRASQIAVIHEKNIVLYDIRSAKQIAAIRIYGNVYSNHLYFTPDDEYLFFKEDGETWIYSAYSGRYVTVLKGTWFQFSKGNKFLYLIDGLRIAYYKNKTFEPVYTAILLDNGDHTLKDVTGCMALLPSSYYKTRSKNISRLVYKNKTNNREIITVDKSDIKYNRPDKVLAQLGSVFGDMDTVLIKAYSHAYQKRIKRLSIDTALFASDYSIMNVDITNNNSIKYEQRDRSLRLHIRGIDYYKLNRFNMLVNDVPVYGSRGIDIRSSTKQIFDTSITICLSRNVNRIEALLTNINGTENNRSPVYVNYIDKDSTPAKVYFIGIGINRFADSTHNLQYCAKDIRDLALKLKERYGASLQIDTLFNEKVTIENVKSIKQKLLQSNEDDKVIIAYSGHGLLSKNYDYYLSTYDVNFNDPAKKGLPYEELENLVDSIKARKKLMLIDACHSGELDKEEIQKIAAVQKGLKEDSVVSPGNKGVKLPAIKSKIGTKNSFELMQELFVNVGKGTGTTIISAAAGTQFALERGDLKNGVFTYSILELLNSGRTVTVNELKKHVSKRVSELTKGLQQPTMRNEIQNVDWAFW